VLVFDDTKCLIKKNKDEIVTQGVQDGSNGLY
jgi:hypothetical protein